VLILGLNAFHGDSSAALVRDGALVAAAEEERFRPRGGIFRTRFSARDATRNDYPNRRPPQQPRAVHYLQIRVPPAEARHAARGKGIEEAEQKIDRPIGHVEEGVYRLPELIVAPQKSVSAGRSCSIVFWTQA
jgi:hypothetical protein